jgi:iron complex transport system ATP-binding protein
MIRADDLQVRYHGQAAAALQGIDLQLDPGELVAVVGPNGSGKSTLLHALVGSRPLSGGTVRLCDRPIETWSPRELARTVAVVLQREETLFPLRVGETVALGRYPYLGALAPAGDRDQAVVETAMRQADVLDLGSRRTDSLSGGEWQRVRIARALAQEPRLLMLDEPTAALDVRHEMEVLELVRRLADQGMAALLVTHHLNLAARFADRMLLLDRGRLAGVGRPDEVMTPARLQEVFEWPVAVTAWDGLPQVVPLRPGERS